MNPVLLFVSILVLAMVAGVVALAWSRTPPPPKEENDELPEWPRWKSDGQTQAETLYGGTAYRITLKETGYDWCVGLWRHRLGRFDLVDSQCQSDKRQAELEFSRLWSLLPDEIDSGRRLHS